MYWRATCLKFWTHWSPLCCARFYGELDVLGGRFQQVIMASNVRLWSGFSFSWVQGRFHEFLQWRGDCPSYPVLDICKSLMEALNWLEQDSSCQLLWCVFCACNFQWTCFYCFFYSPLDHCRNCRFAVMFPVLKLKSFCFNSVSNWQSCRLYMNT